MQFNIVVFKITSFKRVMYLFDRLDSSTRRLSPSKESEYIPAITRGFRLLTRSIEYLINAVRSFTRLAHVSPSFTNRTGCF